MVVPDRHRTDPVGGDAYARLTEPGYPFDPKDHPRTVEPSASPIDIGRRIVRRQA